MHEEYIEEWRELGFYTGSDERLREYQLIGSRGGLQKFVILLREYVRDPRNEMKSEHEHYGPYGMEVMTWPEAGIDDHSIHGPRSKLTELADLIESKLAAANPGDRVIIREEYSPRAEWSLVLDVREDGFDPPSAEEGFEPTTG